MLCNKKTCLASVEKFVNLLKKVLQHKEEILAEKQRTVDVAKHKAQMKKKRPKIFF